MRIQFERLKILGLFTLEKRQTRRHIVRVQNNERSRDGRAGAFVLWGQENKSKGMMFNEIESIKFKTDKRKNSLMQHVIRPDHRMLRHAV